jgi:hypothetical protein
MTIHDILAIIGLLSGIYLVYRGTVMRLEKQIDQRIEKKTRELLHNDR